MIKVAPHIRWLTTKKVQTYKTVKGGIRKIKFETQNNTKLRWLASDIISNCYTLGVLSLMI